MCVKISEIIHDSKGKPKKGRPDIASLQYYVASYT